MSDSEPPSRLREPSSPSGAPASSSWSSGCRWWWHRHLHVPVVVWIVASVLGGAAIGNALESDGTSDQAPTPTEVVSEPRGAVICDENDDTCVPGADYVDCAGTDIGADADVDEPAYEAEPMYGRGADVNDIDCD